MEGGSYKSSLDGNQVTGHSRDPRGRVGPILVAQEGQGVPKSFIWVNMTEIYVDIFLDNESSKYMIYLDLLRYT